MRALTGASCLDLWERGRPLHSLDRGLLALSFALSDAPAVAIPDWPLGRRNHALLNLHRHYFGSRLEAWTTCTSCGEDIELEVSAMDLLAVNGASTSAENDVLQGFMNAKPIELGGRTFRLPTSRDLAHVASAGDPARAARLLVERCTILPGDDSDLSRCDVEEIGASMAAADPLAEIRLAIHCTGCERSWSEPMDIARFLWNEIESRCRRLLREIHILAVSYGWTEIEVLALSDVRRGLYVDMVLGMAEE